MVSIFEIEKGHALPQNKSELVNMIDEKIVIPFHQRYCPSCHKIPGAQKWTKEPELRKIHLRTATVWSLKFCNGREYHQSTQSTYVEPNGSWILR